MRLTEEQANFLRVLGDTLEPVVDVGAGGITNSLLKSIEQALVNHELVKVRVPYGDRERRCQVLDDLAPKAQAHLIQRASNCALLYRRAEHPVIKLPGEDTAAVCD
jgi:RNA-binding protein